MNVGIKDFEVGQTVYAIDERWGATKSTVLTIGRTYVTTDYGVKYKADDKPYLVEAGNRGWNSILFKSERDRMEYEEHNELFKKIRKTFDWASKKSLSLNQLRAINSIIENDLWDFSILQQWYQDSIDDTIPPVWTDEHLEEMLNDFYIAPKPEKERGNND